MTTVSTAPVASITVNRAKPGPGGSIRRCRRPSISPTAIPFSKTVIGSTPPATLTGSAAGGSPIASARSIREPFRGNWIWGACSPLACTSSPTRRKRCSGSGSLALLASSTPFGGFGSGAGSRPVRAKASKRIGAAAVRPTRPGTGAPSGRPTHTPMVSRPSKPIDQASR